MFLKTESLRTTLGLAAFVLAATVAGCSSTPSGYDSSESIGQSAPPPAAPAMPAGDPEPYQPTLVKVSEGPELADNRPDEYVVQVGDTLWDIAGTFLKDPWFWPEIWFINPEIENPHLIYPGDTLGIVMIDGQPRVTNVRASTYRMSPEARVTPLTEAVTSIPYESISAFLTTGVVLEKKQVKELPYMLDSRGDHLVAAAGNDVYVRGIGNEPNGTRFSVVHIGDPLIDPDDNKLVGYQGIWVGEGTMRRGGDPATIRLNETTQEAIKGDKFIPETIDIPLNFFPKAPNSNIDGRIISVVNGVTQIGQYQVVVVNRGTTDGLNVGDVLTVYQAGEVVRDRFSGGKVKLPDEAAGTVMMFKVYDNIGYGLVMEATQPLLVLDAVRNPI